MNPTALAALLLTSLIAGALMLVASRLERGGSSGTVRRLIAFVALIAVFAVLTLALAALDKGSGDAPAALYALGAVVLTCITFLLVRSGTSQGDQSHDNRADSLNLFAWAYLLTPLCFVVGVPMLCCLVLVYFVYLWFRWRRLKQSGLLMILSEVVQLERPLSDLFSVGRRATWGWRRRFNDFAYNLQSGMCLSDAAELSRTIEPNDVTLIRAAELADAVERELPRMSQETSRRIRRGWLPGGMVGVFFYLHFVSIIFLLTGAFLLVFIVPQFKVIFEDFGIEFHPLSESAFDIISKGVAAWPVILAGLALWLAAILFAAFVGVAGTGALPGWMQRWGPSRWSTPLVLRVVATFVESRKMLSDSLTDLASRSRSTFWHDRWLEIAHTSSRGGDVAEVLAASGDLSVPQSNGLRSAANLGSGADRAQALFLRNVADGTESRSRRGFNAVSAWLSAGLFAVFASVVLLTAAGVFLCLVQLITQLVLQIDPIN